MSNLIVLACNDTSPEVIIQAQCDELKKTKGKTTTNGLYQHILIHYTFKEYWLNKQAECQLSAFVKIQCQNDDVEILFTVTNQPEDFDRYLIQCEDSTSPDNKELNFLDVCDKLSLPYFIVGKPILLSSINIPKPWGQEIWFTGIEERGVSKVKGLVNRSCGSANNSDERTLPLPWVLSVFPSMLCNNQHQSLILLKILDPSPQKIMGDLYFELHEEKKEVYVVTSIDEKAWPNGEGEIRIGVNQDKRREYSSDDLYRSDFIKAVKEYEVVRRKIDNENLMNDQSLQLKEESLRLHMESFTDRRTLRVGDVVKVPCLTPHSLQHGVRTVEFQTPVYERLILSFAQKVLTQNHWDTERAVELMTLDAEVEVEVASLLDEKGVFIEQIVDFDDFNVIRVELREGARWFLAPPVLYSLVMGIGGSVVIDTVTVESEQAMLLSPLWSGAIITNNSDKKISFLLAQPK